MLHVLVKVAGLLKDFLLLDINATCTCEGSRSQPKGCAITVQDDSCLILLDTTAKLVISTVE